MSDTKFVKVKLHLSGDIRMVPVEEATALFSAKRGSPVGDEAAPEKAVKVAPEKAIKGARDQKAEPAPEVPTAADAADMPELAAPTA